MLFNEPKLLKLRGASGSQPNSASFSALQRAEIAEMLACVQKLVILAGFSALQRAEIAEISLSYTGLATGICFSALQRAEIAEMLSRVAIKRERQKFQCSSTSRNC